MRLTGEREAIVFSRAGYCCEYCRMHQGLQGATFHIEHIVPRAKSGSAELTNLALACPSCNLRKADRTEGIDPDSGARVPLFHPRQQLWSEHFRFGGHRIEGLTETGRATVDALDLNQSRRMLIRAVEEKFDLFPPTR